jgi:hypothetical protein
LRQRRQVSQVRAGGATFETARASFVQPNCSIVTKLDRNSRGFLIDRTTIAAAIVELVQIAAAATLQSP